MNLAPAGMSGADFARRVAAEVLIFAVLGPLVGALVFIFGFGALTGDLQNALMITSFFVVYFPLLALGYVLGWKAAVVTGLVMGLVRGLVTASLPRHAAVLGLAGLVGAFAAVLLFPATGDMLEGNELVQGLILLAIAGAVAAVACALVSARLWRPAARLAAEGVS